MAIVVSNRGPFTDEEATYWLKKMLAMSPPVVSTDDEKAENSEGSENILHIPAESRILDSP